MYGANFCLDIEKNNINNNDADIIITKCNKSMTNQFFTLTDDGQIINSTSKKCLELDNSANNVFQNKCNINNKYQI